MINNNSIHYLFILIGAVIAIYANANEEQHLVLLIIGIVVLMFGVFKLQATIPSKNSDEQFVESETIDEEE